MKSFPFDRFFRIGTLLLSLLLGLSSANPKGKAFKWQVGIVHRVLGYRICGGSIINERFVLTSGNCVYPHQAEDLEVVLEDDLEHHRVAALVPRLYLAYRRTSVKEIVTHLDYDPDSLAHDIALLELETKIEYTKTVGAICLPDRNKEEDYKNMYATQSGWGFLPVFYGPAPSLLPPRNMQILSRDQCTAPHPTQICAINRFYKFNTCVADPGGSLSVEYNNLPVLVGVVGKLNQCPLSGSNGEIPGLYTSVPEHLDWIAENTQGTLSCVPYRT